MYDNVLNIWNNYVPTADENSFIDTLNNIKTSAPITKDVQYRELLFKIADYWDQKKNYHNAFITIKAANDYWRNFCIDGALLQAIRHMTRIEEDLKGDIRTAPKKTTITPVFFIGLPRSGKSTLAKLLQHVSPRIANGDEIEAPRMTMANIHDDPTMDNYQKLFAATLQNAFAEYQFMIDTAPTNLPYIGITAQAFINTKIIICTRETPDIYWDIYRKHFGELTFDFSCAPEMIKTYDMHYKQAVDHYIRKHPDQIFIQPTEALLDNPRIALKNICEFIELEAPDISNSLKNNHKQLQAIKKRFETDKNYLPAFEELLN